MSLAAQGLRHPTQYKRYSYAFRGRIIAIVCIEYAYFEVVVQSSILQYNTKQVSIVRYLHHEFVSSLFGHFRTG